LSDYGRGESWQVEVQIGKTIARELWSAKSLGGNQGKKREDASQGKVGLGGINQFLSKGKDGAKAVAAREKGSGNSTTPKGTECECSGGWSCDQGKRSKQGVKGLEWVRKECSQRG